MATPMRTTKPTLTRLALFLGWLQLSRALLYPSRISTGVYEEDLTSDTIFYDSFLSIIFEYRVPSWTNIEITLRDWRPICQTHEFAPSFTCPVFFYLERFIERMQAELVGQSSMASFGQLTSQIPNVTQRCSRIQKHFATMLTSKDSMDNYIHSLASTCHLRGHVIKRSSPDYIYNIKAIYSSMVRKFEAEFSTKAGTVSDRKGPAYYVNQITAAQSSMLLNYLFEKNRWDSAIKSCAMRLVPTSLVKSLNLTAALSKIESEAKKQGHALSISVNNTALYIMAPLTDCSFTGSPIDSLVVRIQVPLLRNSFSPRLLRLRAIPFLLDNEDDLGPSVCQIFDNLSGLYLYDEASGYLTQTSCQSQLGSNLCQVPSNLFRTLPNLCASAYFSRSLPTMKKYCRLQCERVVDNMAPLPIFSRVSANTFIVTGNPDIQVSVKCPGKHDQILNPNKFGSIEVSLACLCFLHFNSQTFLPEQPCPDEVTLTYITPLQIFSSDFLSQFNPEMDNFTGVINETIMDTRYFKRQNPVTGQVDIKTGFTVLGPGGDFEVASLEGVETEPGRQSSLTSLWVFVILQTIAFTCFVLFVLIKFGLFPSYNRFYTKDPRLGHSADTNPDLSASTQNIIQDDQQCHL